MLRYIKKHKNRWLSAEKIKEGVGIGISSVYRAIRKLIEQGYLEEMWVDSFGYRHRKRLVRLKRR